MGFQLDELTEMLTALGEQLAAARAEPVSLVVCGGTAMNALGFVARPTHDVDVVALLETANVGSSVQRRQAAPLPANILAARSRVASDFDVPEDWLNDGPASLLHFGLPAGANSAWSAGPSAATLPCTSWGALTSSA